VKEQKYALSCLNQRYLIGRCSLDKNSAPVRVCKLCHNKLLQPGGKEAMADAEKEKHLKTETGEVDTEANGDTEAVKSINRLLRSLEQVKMCVACYNVWEFDGGAGFYCPDEPDIQLHRACKHMADDAWVQGRELGGRFKQDNNSTGKGAKGSSGCSNAVTGLGSTHAAAMQHRAQEIAGLIGVLHIEVERATELASGPGGGGYFSGRRTLVGSRVTTTASWIGMLCARIFRLVNIFSSRLLSYTHFPLRSLNPSPFFSHLPT
jgi:hypothetical protein